MTYPDLRILDYVQNSKDEMYYEDAELMIFINFSDDQIIIHEIETGEEVIFDAIPDDLRYLEPEQECFLSEAEFYGYA